MPVLTRRHLAIDHTDDGAGAPVILIHSSVSGNRQWRSLVEVLKPVRRVLAVNLFGYGETTPWPPGAPQTLYAQAQLVLALCERLEGPVSLVGHSFGGSVALKSAELLGARVDRVVLLEPNPVHLLPRAGRIDAFREARELRDHVKLHGALGDWDTVAERFADYWLGDGAWSAMPEKRRSAFLQALRPNFHEWDAVMDEFAPIEAWAALPARVLVVSDPGTRRPIREIVEILRGACPHWAFREIAEGGHMAPLTHPAVVDPIVRDFLVGNPAGSEHSVQ